MATIHSTFADRWARIEDAGDSTVLVAAAGQVSNEAAWVPRAEFLAAVADELDCIIIPRTDLPEVTEVDDRGTLHAGDMFYGPGPDVRPARDLAMDYLAIAEHLDAHPPVDEAQVNALAKVLGDMDNSPAPMLGDYDMARRLLATGRITVKEA